MQMILAAPPESGIRIDFPGKLSVRSILGKLRPRVQRRLPHLSCGGDEEQAGNLVVEGDNLQVMASLYRYRGQIDLIIADPPYNTGKDFRYNDRWDEDPNDPNPGEIVSAEDGGRHSKWMRFMAPRLEMMKAMLKPGGVCAVCIDDREIFRLGMMMDETFGEHNRLGIINWQKTYSAKNDSSHVSTATEYVLVYAKGRDKARTELLGRTDEMNARYSNPDKDPNAWTGGDLSARAHPKPEDYGIQSPFTGEIHYPPGNRRWGVKKSDIKIYLEAWGSAYVEMKDPNSTLPSLVLKGTVRKNGGLMTPLDVLQEARERAVAVRNTQVWPQLFFLTDGEGRPRTKRYLKDVKKGRVPMTYWADEEYETPFVLDSQSWEHAESGHSQAGINELAAIVGPKHNFETVKPLKLFAKSSSGSTLVTTFLQHVSLGVFPKDPVQVGPVSYDIDKKETFNNSIHPAYSGLNKLERECALAIDALGWPWYRNPQSGNGGFALPRFEPGSSRKFYPDFIILTDATIWLMDTKGDHLIQSDAGRKLIAVDPAPGSQQSLKVCFITQGSWDHCYNKLNDDGVTAWRLRAGQVNNPEHYADMNRLLKKIVAIKKD